MYGALPGAAGSARTARHARQPGDPTRVGSNAARRLPRFTSAFAATTANASSAKISGCSRCPARDGVLPGASSNRAEAISSTRRTMGAKSASPKPPLDFASRSQGATRERRRSASARCLGRSESHSLRMTRINARTSGASLMSASSLSERASRLDGAANPRATTTTAGDGGKRRAAGATHRGDARGGPVPPPAPGARTLARTLARVLARSPRRTHVASMSSSPRRPDVCNKRCGPRHVNTRELHLGIFLPPSPHNSRRPRSHELDDGEFPRRGIRDAVDVDGAIRRGASARRTAPRRARSASADPIR